jgi:predicted nucleic acid-binding protein
MKVVVDTNVLVSAKAVRADLIVSGDSHLLKLGRWAGKGIVTPKEAIEKINDEA